MAPPPKRKRPERTYTQDGDSGGRPSPHRPHNMNLAQQNQYNNSPGGGGRSGGGSSRGRRDSRGGAGAGGGRRGERDAAADSPSSTPAVGPSESNIHSSAPASHHANLHRSDNVPASPTVSRPQQQVQSAPHSRPSTPAEKPASDRPGAPPASATSKIPMRFTYQYLTDEHRTAWKTSGRKAVLDAAVQAQESGDILALSVIFQELVEAGLGGRIDSTDAGQVVKELLSQAGDKAQDTASFFLDSVSILAEIDAESPALKSIIAAAEIPPAMVREELDVPLLTVLGMVRITFFKMGTRHATNQLYRQSNYNLLREESEGYSKLMTEYFTTTNSEPPSGETAADTFQRVKALIGAFDLDVGRVLDVTLDVFANLLVKHYRFFIKFLRVSSWWPEEKGLKGLEWTTLGLESLPRWAQPGCSGWLLSEEDREQLAKAKEERDQVFWSRLKEVGFEAFFELGARRITSGDVSVEELEAEKSKKPEDITEAEFNREWIAQTKTLPPAGNRVAAQLLGFKLRFYASSARDPHDVLPDNLIFLAALLIKIGFISLRDLYPHLYPLDKDMAQVKETLLKEKEEREKKARGGGTLNALATAGALADDTAPLPLGASRLREVETSRSASVKPEEKPGATPKPEEEEKEKLPEPADQKIALLKSLLCIGAIPESMYILGKFPWLPDVHPDLPEYIHRILNHSISKVYESLRPLSDRDGIRSPKKPISSEAGAAKGDLRFAEAQPRKVLRWAQLDRNGSNDNEIDYRFYWDDWADNVPVCQNVDDVFSLCGSLLNFSGVKIGHDPALLTKLARIGKWSLAEDKSEGNFKRWADLAKRLIVPALSLTKSNPGVVNEVWDLLKLYPTATRYNIYAEWYTGQTSRLEDMKSAFAQSTAETKDVLKRISKTNTKQQARALAKVAYSSPGIVFRVALNQIESYDNLVEVIVECARYFTYLGYDVLTWSLMNSLGGKGRDRVQADGMLTSRWLQALSLFAGRAFKRYSIMNPTPILSYVTHQLRAGNSTDLEVLEQFLSQMAGIPADAVFNDNQTMAMAGGEVLQAQTLEQIHDQRYQHKSFAKRLLKALVEPGLAGQLLVAIAQERQLYPHRDSVSDAPLKVLGTNLDKFHQVFTQYLEVLRTNMTPKEFDAAIPDIVSLMAEFGIEAQTAFAVGRPSLSQAIAEADAATAAEKAKEEQERKENAKAEKAATNGDIEMGEASDDKEAGETNDDTKEESKEEVKDDSPETPSAATPAPTATIPEEPWHPVLTDLMARMRPSLPEDFDQKMSLSFYTTFWQLSLNDMHVPTASYELEIKRQQEKISSLMSDRSDVSVAGIKKRDDKKKAIMDLQDRLRSEMKNQISTYQTCRGRLSKEKNHWFATHPLSFSPKLHDNIIQECFLPRLVLSPFDAHYTFKMLFFLHSSGTPGFKMMYLVDRLMRDKLLTNLIFMSTVREAENLGRFLNELLKELRRWHASQEVYEKHAFGPKRDLPGFLRRLPEKTEELLNYEDFRRLLYKWHINLNNALKACFTGGEYMHIRNAITILKAVHQNFPALNFHGKAQLDAIESLGRSETREDLKLAATSLIGDLRKRQSQWLLPQAFRLVGAEYCPDTGTYIDLIQQVSDRKKQADTPAQKPSSRQGTEGPGTPKPDQNQTGGTKLDGAAPEFKPGSATNGTTPNGTANNNAGAEDSKKMQTVEQPPGTAKVTTSTTGDQTESKKPDESRGNQSDKEKSSDSRPPTPAYAQIHRSDSSKLSTPVPSHSGSSLPRPDMNRVASQPNMRQPHALPNRPEPQIARGRMSDRPSDPHSRRGDGRGPQPPSDYGRLERPGDMNRDFPDRSRDQSSGRRRTSRSPAPAHMDRDRRGEPQWQPGREAWEHAEDRQRGPPRDVRQSARGPPQWNEPPPRRAPFDGSENQRGRPPFDPQVQPNDGWSRQPGTMPPPSSTGPYSHPDRLGRLGERPHMGAPLPERPTSVERSGMNPERLALIEKDMAAPPERERRGRGSRPHSPARRGGEERPPSYQPRDDYRDDRRLPNQDRMPPNYPPSRERREDPNSIPPTGPRSDRSGRSDFPGPPPSRGGRELFEPTPPRPPSDPNHGRLNQDFPRTSDPSYGRLNAPDVPSGPRGRGARIGARSNAPDSRPSPSVPQSQHNDRGPPSGPTAERRGDQRVEIPNDQAPSSAADMAGVHPSRLSQIPGGRNDMPAPSASSSFPPPAGPRGHTSVKSPTTGRPAPTGPASNDKDKRFSHLANVLAQSSASSGGYSRGDSDRGASIRGRANRPGATHSPTHSQPSTPMPSQYDNQVGSGRSGMDSRASDRGDLVSSNMPEDHRMDQHRSSSRREHRRSIADNMGTPGGEQSGMHRRSMRHRSTSPPGSSSMGGGSMRESRDSGRSSRADDRRSGGHGSHSHGHSSSSHHGHSSHGGPPNGDGSTGVGGSSGQTRGNGRERRGEGREPRERGGDREDGRRSERKRPRGGDGAGGDGGSGGMGNESKRPRRNARGDGDR